MGDPRKQKKKYKTPSHPWESERIQQEKVLKEEYGLKNKKEIWKFNSKIRNINKQARKILASTTEQSEKERKQLIEKLYKQGIIEKDAKIDDVLELKIKQILDRRLQTLVFKKGLTKTINQARQFITHKGIFVNNKLISTPSYIVLRDEEDKVTFNPTSPLSNPEHPERKIVEKKIEKPEEESKKIEKEGLELASDEEKFKKTETKAQEILKDLQDKKLEQGVTIK